MDDRTRTPVRKALEIVAVLADTQGSLRLTDIADRAGMIPSTALRAMSELLEASWVVRLDDDTYALGPAVLSLARPAVLTAALAHTAWPMLRELSRQTEMMANLQVLEPGGSRVVAATSSTRYGSVGDRLGVLVPIEAAAGGIVQVAQLAERDQRSWLARVDGVRSRREFRDALAAARRDGYSHLSRRLDPLLSAVACAVVGVDDRCLAGVVTIGVAGEVEERLAEVVRRTREAADRLEKVFRPG